MKALILAGGKGTQLRPLTYTGAKQLVPVANKPVLWYGIEAIVEAGITNIGIVINPATGQEVKTKTGNGEPFGANITFILWTEPAGIAHAARTGRLYLQDSPFVMYLADKLIQDSLVEFTTVFKEKALDTLILLRADENHTPLWSSSGRPAEQGSY